MHRCISWDTRKDREESLWLVGPSQKGMSVLAFGPEPFELCVLADGKRAASPVEPEQLPALPRGAIRGVFEVDS
jgi:hypothetical protein